MNPSNGTRDCESRNAVVISLCAAGVRFLWSSSLEPVPRTISQPTITAHISAPFVRPRLRSSGLPCLARGRFCWFVTLFLFSRAPPFPRSSSASATETLRNSPIPIERRRPGPGCDCPTLCCGPWSLPTLASVPRCDGGGDVQSLTMNLPWEIGAGNVAMRSTPA